jgi:hypothetical protein
MSPHNDLHIRRDHDRGTVTAARERHSMTLRASIAAGKLVLGEPVNAVDLVPLRAVEKLTRRTLYPPVAHPVPRKTSSKNRGKSGTDSPGDGKR